MANFLETSYSGIDTKQSSAYLVSRRMGWSLSGATTMPSSVIGGYRGGGVTHFAVYVWIRRFLRGAADC